MGLTDRDDTQEQNEIKNRMIVILWLSLALSLISSIMSLCSAYVAGWQMYTINESLSESRENARLCHARLSTFNELLKYARPNPRVDSAIGGE